MQEEIREYASRLLYMIPAIARLCIGESKQKIMPLSLTYPEVVVLGYLYYENAFPCMSELGQALFIDLSTLTRVVDRLVEKGMVIRKSDPSDRRVVRIHLSLEGKKTVEDLKRKRTEMLEYYLGKLTLEERKELVELLEKFYQRMVKEENSLK